MKPNILLIGCGPHARRVYIPTIKDMENNFGSQIVAYVELNENKENVSEFMLKFYPNAKGIFINPFVEKYKHSLPNFLEKKLNKVIIENNINCVIISTDPINHIQYALWALKNNLHILMDKPISTYSNVSNSVAQARQIKKDFKILVENYSKDKAFIINAQRRFLPQFEIVQNYINDIAEKYGIPITSMQSTHSDGQWRLPNEILEIKYHPLIGWGKVSHSGYHFIDMAGKLIKDSFISSRKKFNFVSAFSKFIRPSGLLKQLSSKDFINIFGDEYLKVNKHTDNELIELYKKNNEAEVDAMALINFSSNDIPITNFTLNLIHNGFSRRSWLVSNKDLYKGNGRVRHEYHNIQQGPFQNIQIHSYQSSDKHDIVHKNDFDIGGINHYDIYIYRNTGVIGGKLIERITGKDIAEQYSLDETKIMNELARHEAIKEFFEVVVGKRKAICTRGNLLDNELSVLLMSMIYESAILKKEIQNEYNF